MPSTEDDSDTSDEDDKPLAAKYGSIHKKAAAPKVRSEAADDMDGIDASNIIKGGRRRGAAASSSYAEQEGTDGEGEDDSSGDAAPASNVAKARAAVNNMVDEHLAAAGVPVGKVAHADSTCLAHCTKRLGGPQ